MKTPTLILAVSLLANGLLATAFVSARVGRSGAAPGRDLGGAGATAVAPRGAPAVAPVGGDAAVADPGASTSDQLGSLGLLLRSGSGEELARSLRAAGVPEDMIRALVREQIQARYRAQIRAIEDAGRGDRPWWQSGGRVVLTPEQRAEIRKLQRDMRTEIDRALGPDESQPGRAGNYAFLPADKAEAARQIDADYAEMARELRDRMDEFRLPSDRDALRLLEEERRADLASLLSPAEVFDLEMRTSSISGRLRRELGSVVQSEEEFRRIYEMAVAFDQQYGREGAAAQGMNRADRNTAETAFRQQVMDMLGPERTAELARQRDPDYRTMQAASARLNLPPTATDTVINTRAQAAAESQRIAADATLDAATRRAALNDLAARVRTQLQSTMGSEGGEAFAQRAEWLRALERGQSFSIRPEGGVNIQRGRGDG
ncbi:MAG: hypothetical protein IAE82_14235 [Opitutaceae bacterium]|nr:hypothetical protein [Opitutaceae bacterium]